MIFCNIKVFSYLKRHQHSLSIVSRRIQSDLNRMMTAQAIIPVLTTYMPMSILLVSGFVDGDLVFESFICGILCCWIPTGNAISVLFFVSTYRRKLTRLFINIKQVYHARTISTIIKP